MNVAEGIELLLQSHERVVIPDLGVFVTEEVSASIHPAEHSFHPPHKKISFRSEHDKRDSRLKDFLREKNKNSEEDIDEELRRFVSEIKNSLQEKGAYELQGVGKFYFDIERKLQFASLPEKNFLLSSFGLPEFISKPILRPENIPNYTIKKSAPEKKKKKFIWFRF